MVVLLPWVGSPCKPTVRELSALKLLIVNQLYDLGTKLGMKFDLFERLEEVYSHDSRMKQNKLFDEWLKMDSEASWEKLHEALCNIGEKKLAKCIDLKYGRCTYLRVYGCLSEECVTHMYV